MNLPEIRIRSSFLLNDAFIPLLLPGLKKTGDEIAATDDFIDKKVNEYNESWKPYEKRILTSMCEVLDLEFRQNTIDAYVLPFYNSFSDPMVISTKYSGDRFIEVFTHEVIHRLLTDNNKLKNDESRERLVGFWKEIFGEEHSFNTLVHIPVHAVLEHVFTETLDEPERVQRDIELCSKYEHYALAWKYVKEKGYKNVIKQAREVYLISG